MQESYARVLQLGAVQHACSEEQRWVPLALQVPSWQNLVRHRASLVPQPVCPSVSCMWSSRAQWTGELATVHPCRVLTPTAGIRHAHSE